MTSADPLLTEAVRIARTNSCRILLVGGAVRDLALGRDVVDLDFILEGPPRRFLGALARALGHRIVTFRKRGIVDHRVRAGEREWDFVERGRRSLRREILRRDFALNAVAWVPDTNTILDPAGGLQDLANRRIRAISERGFHDDPLRMLRAVRLRAEIAGLAIERRTARLIARDARLLARVSPERIKSEIDRILSAPCPSASIRLLDRLGLVRVVFPELDPLRGLLQNRYHHLDAFRHTLAALEAADDLPGLARGLPSFVFLNDPLEFPPAKQGARPALPSARARLLRWALLLHDTGKAETRTRGEDGEYHFFMHERASARIARAVLRRLRASRAETAAIETLVALHLRISIPPEGAMTPRALRRIVKDAGDLTPLLVLHSLADKIASRGAGQARALAKIRRAGRDLLQTWKTETERMHRMPRLLDGHAIMRALGLPPGPSIGALLAEIEELQSAGEIRTREQALEWLASNARRIQEGSPPATEAGP